MVEQECVRCGFRYEVSASRKSHEVCQSCRARKQQKIGDCLPWHGNFGYDLITPIDDDGQAVMPGYRVCGNVDCVSSKHVRPF